MKLSIETTQQIRRGKIIGVTAGRYLISMGKSSVFAYGKGYNVGDSVLVAYVNNKYSIVSPQGALSDTVKEVFING
jgi:hypothetical protein